jgi:hypothetical protein
MTTETNTQKMIYADSKVANMILGKMKKRQPEETWELVKLPVGWQVARIQKLPAYMPSAKPAPVMVPEILAKAEEQGDFVAFSVPLADIKVETAKWFDFKGPKGSKGKDCVYKGHLIAWQIDQDAGLLHLKMPAKKAKEKGFDVLAA